MILRRYWASEKTRVFPIILASLGVSTRTLPKTQTSAFFRLSTFPKNLKNLEARDRKLQIKNSEKMHIATLASKSQTNLGNTRPKRIFCRMNTEPRHIVAPGNQETEAAATIAGNKNKNSARTQSAQGPPTLGVCALRT